MRGETGGVARGEKNLGDTDKLMEVDLDGRERKIVETVRVGNCRESEVE